MLHFLVVSHKHYFGVQASDYNTHMFTKGEELIIILGMRVFKGLSGPENSVLCLSASNLKMLYKATTLKSVALFTANALGLC